MFTWEVGLPWWLSRKESACNAGDARETGSNPKLGRSPGGGNGNPVQYSCQENSMNRRAWQAMSLRLQRVGYNCTIEHTWEVGLNPPNPTDQGSLTSRIQLMPDDLRWNWHHHQNNNKMYSKCNELESSWNHPPHPGSWKNSFKNWSLGSKRLGIAATDNQGRCYYQNQGGQLDFRKHSKTPATKIYTPRMSPSTPLKGSSEDASWDNLCGLKYWLPTHGVLKLDDTDVLEMTVCSLPNLVTWWQLKIGYSIKEAQCVSHSTVSDSATPWTVAHQAPLSMGFSR